MNLSDVEKKLIILALDKGSAIGERDNAAVMLLNFFRKKYKDGYALVKDLEGLPEPVIIEKVIRVESKSDQQKIRETYGTAVLGFGKHKGRMIKEVPADYLLWCLEYFEAMNPTMRKAMEGYLGIGTGRRTTNSTVPPNQGGFDFS